MVSENPDLMSSYSAGTTYEKREIKVLKIHEQSSTTKKTIWMGKFIN